MADPRFDVTCKECGDTFQRRTLVGRAPERCADCKTIRKQKELNKLRRAKGLDTYPEDKAVIEPRPELPPLPDLPKYEESWLDDEAAQAQLVAQKAAPESSEPESSEPDWWLKPTNDETDRLSCSVLSCRNQPTQVNRFCLNHWLRIPLDTRGVLLGATAGTPPFDAALTKALRQLRAVR